MSYRNSVKYCEVCNRDISYINFSKHCNTEKHKGNVYNSEKARRVREKRTIERQLNNEKICSILKKLSIDDMEFILQHNTLVVDALKLEVNHNKHK
jgi:hypothetical protein